MRTVQPGTIVGGDYEIQKRLGGGGMGAVYIARQISTTQLRALKVMHLDLVSEPGLREKFIFEGQAGARVKSQHVVQVLDAGVDEEHNFPWIAMELLDGDDLAAYVEKRPELSGSEIALIATHTFHALAAAHAAEIVHRDIKPENVFLSAANIAGMPFIVKVLDFGIARVVQTSRAATAMLGSPPYMAPEQAQLKGQILPSTDVWALGLLMFYVMTGKHYWLAANEADTNLNALVSEVLMSVIEPPSARAARYGVAHRVPEGFDDWFALAVTRAQSERFANAAAAYQALQPIVQRGMAIWGAGASVAETGKTQLGNSASGPFGGTGETVLGNASGSGPVSMPRSGIGATAPWKPGTLPALSGTPIGMSAAVQPAKGGRGMVFGGAAVALAGLAGLAYVVQSKTSTTAMETPTAAAEPPAASATPIAAAPEAAPSAIPAPALKAEVAELEVDDDDAKRPAGSDGAVDIAAGNVAGAAVGAFHLDKLEVTVAAYQKCVTEKKCGELPQTAVWVGVTESAKQKFGAMCNGSTSDRSDHPVTCVPLEEAHHYCAWRDARLPTEREWELATFGGGAEANWEKLTKQLNACDSTCSATYAKPSIGGTDTFSGSAPVASFAANHRGAYDLLGNVWEWSVPDSCAAESKTWQALEKCLVSQEKKRATIQGGSYWNEDKGAFTATGRRHPIYTERVFNVGFRCADD